MGPWGSRLISATRLLVTCVFSCYTPTFATSIEEKDNFYNLIQSTVPENEPLGDFNARVGNIHDIGGGKGGGGGARGLKPPLGLLRGGLAPPQNDITPKLSFLEWG